MRWSKTFVTILVLVQVAVVGAIGLEVGYFLRDQEGVGLNQKSCEAFASAFQRLDRARARDIPMATKRIACDQSAQFVIDHMPKLNMSPGRLALLTYSLSQVGATKGLYCEFGVAEGESINHIARQVPDITIHGFDSFEGLPETWRAGFGKGAFSTSGLPQVEKNVELYKGWFDKSVPEWAKEHPGPIAFMHLDADLYSSTKTVFDILGDRVVPGTIIQFDEFFNYPGWQKGEHQAFMEFVASRKIEFEYLGYSVEQVAVRILRVGDQGGQ